MWLLKKSEWQISIVAIPNKTQIIKVVLYVMILPIIFVLLKISDIIFSYTGSVPIGFYRIISSARLIQPGDIVSFCLPDKIAQIGLSRGYLTKGQCKNGSEPLMKEVIAVPGDQVMVSDDQLEIVHASNTTNYMAISNVIDKNKLPVMRFIRKGKYIATGYWVYGFGSPRYSWDSRYYGEIPKDNVTHRLVALWLW